MSDNISIMSPIICKVKNIEETQKVFNEGLKTCMQIRTVCYAVKVIDEENNIVSVVPVNLEDNKDNTYLQRHSFEESMDLAQRLRDVVDEKVKIIFLEIDPQKGLDLEADVWGWEVKPGSAPSLLSHEFVTPEEKQLLSQIRSLPLEQQQYIYKELSSLINEFQENFKQEQNLK